MCIVSPPRVSRTPSLSQLGSVHTLTCGETFLPTRDQIYCREPPNPCVKWSSSNRERRIKPQQVSDYRVPLPTAAFSWALIE